MWEKWEQRYSDHLPLHFNSLNLYVNEHTSIHQTTSACKNKAKPYKFMSNYKQRSQIIWPRGASENMFEFKHLTHSKIGRGEGGWCKKLVIVKLCVKRKLKLLKLPPNSKLSRGALENLFKF